MTASFLPESRAPFRASAPKAGPWNVLCDFDGTITPFDVTDAILSAFAHPSWEEVEREWLSGRITARECMERQVELVKTPAVILDAWLDEVPMTPGFAEFTRLCKARGIGLVVVSDGLDHAIRRILTRHELPNLPVIANRLRYKGNSAWRLEFPYGADGCPSGVCKCGVAKALGNSTLLIGDGRSDCCAAGAVSMTFARRGKELSRHCADNGLAHLEFDDFHDAAALLESLISGEAARPEALPGREIARPTETLVRPAKSLAGSAELAGGREAAAGLLDAVLGVGSGRAFRL